MVTVNRPYILIMLQGFQVHFVKFQIDFVNFQIEFVISLKVIINQRNIIQGYLVNSLFEFINYMWKTLKNNIEQLIIIFVLWLFQ